MRIDIIRRVKTDNYSVVDNTIYRDKRIDLKARGLWSTVMGLPPDWDFSVKGMASILPNGRDSIYSCLDDLAKYGYVQKIRMRDKGTGHFRGWKYVFHETPLPALPDTVNPDTANPTQLSKQRIKQTSNVERIHAGKLAGPPVHESDTPDPVDEVDIDSWAFGVEDLLDSQPLLLPSFLPRKKSDPRVDPIQPVTHAIMYRICYRAEEASEIAGLTTHQRGRVASVLGQLSDAGADLSRLQHFEDWWVNNWRSRDKQTNQYQAPRPEQVQELWAEAMKSGSKPKDEKVRDNKPVDNGPSVDIADMMQRRAEMRGGHK